MYFSMFPKIDYDLLGNGTTNRFTNITKRALISNHVRKNIVNFDFYDVVDGESPEIIADLYYKNVYLHWLVLFSNDIVNVYDQWPKSVTSLENYINEKYDDPFGVHHYTINQTSGDPSQKIIIIDNKFYSNADIVSNYQYESELNDAKRRIRLIQPQYVEQIISEYRYVLKDN